MTEPAQPSAAEVIALLRARGWTLGTAESLTGGLLCSTLVDLPGASAVVRGGIVAYAAQVKADVLGIEADLLAREGTVHPDVASGMARSARVLLTSDIGVSTTGVAGPDPVDGQSVGTVFVAAATARAIHVERLALTGSRRDIREQTVAAALRLVSRVCVSGPAGNVGSKVRIVEDEHPRPDRDSRGGHHGRPTPRAW